ncbi:MAG: winged helix-turn-helix transcriptional regulator [Candidatus Helarchaeota archaeon]
MSELEGSKLRKSMSFKSKGKKNIRQDILELLQRSKYGLNISQIVKKLGLSRNTVKKYMQSFEKEDLIEVKEIGRSKICLFKKQKKNRNVDIFRTFFFDFATSLFDAYDQVAASYLISDSKEFLKEIGRKMSVNFEFPQITPEDYFDSARANVNESRFLMQVAHVSKQFLEFFNTFGQNMLQVEIVPPKINENEPVKSVTLRVQNVSNEFGESVSFYHLWSGFYETRLRKNFKVNICIDVLEFQKENSCCYFEIYVGETSC